MKLTRSERNFLFEVMDHLTDQEHFYKIYDEDKNKIANELFKKLRLEIIGF